MKTKDFESLQRGLAEVEAYKAGKRAGFVVHEPVDVRALRVSTELRPALVFRALRPRQPDGRAMGTGPPPPRQEQRNLPPPDRKGARPGCRSRLRAVNA